MNDVKSPACKAHRALSCFYFHFPTKEHILLELQWRMDTEISAAVAAIKDSSEALHYFVEQLVTVEDELGNSELFRDVLQM